MARHAWLQNPPPLDRRPAGIRIFIGPHDYDNAPAPFAALATAVSVLVMALFRPRSAG